MMGKIVESGTHEELLSNKGHYYGVYKAQYGDYLDEVDRKKTVRRWDKWQEINMMLMRS